MTRPGDGLEDTAGILRAVGSLLTALSGGDNAQVEQMLGALQDDAFDEPLDAPRAAPRSRGGSGARSRQRAMGEAEFVLADARERAQQILDESMERARMLLSGDHGGGVDPRAVDELRRGVRGLITEVRDIQRRLSRIEGLLRARQSGGEEAAREAPSAYREPDPGAGRYEAPPEQAAPSPQDYGFGRGAYAPPEPSPDEPRAYGAAYQEPEYGAQTREPAYEPYSEPEREYGGYGTTGGGAAEEPPGASASDHEAYEEAPEPPTAHAPAPAPPRGSFSVVPPQRRDWASEDEEPGAVEPPSAPPPSAIPRVRAVGAEGVHEPVPAEWPPRAAEERPTAAGGPIATFAPGDGPVTLRIHPVAGFQGLMRVQDALARLPTVRQASVESYSQGEARLRVELVDAVDSQELADGLAQALNSPARVEEASEVHREMLIALR